MRKKSGMKFKGLGILLIGLLLFGGQVGVRANGQPPDIRYGETLTGEIRPIPGAVCGLIIEYAFAGHPGDVISIEVTRLGGDLMPLIVLEQGNQRVESTLAADGSRATLPALTLLARKNYYFSVASLNNTTGTFSVTLSLLHREAPPGVQTFSVGQRPSHSVWDGSRLYVSNRDSQTLSVLDAQGNILQTIPFPGSPAAMQWDGERLWVADRLGDSVYTFAPDGTLLDQYVVGEVPISISYAPQDGYMWIALYDASQVVVLDRAGAEVFRLDLPAKPSTVVAHPLSYANVALYGAADRPSDQVITVSVEGKILEDFAYTLYDYPNELVLDGNLLYVAYDMILGDGSSLVTQIDLASGITVDMVVEDGKVIEMAAVDRHLWLTLDSNAVIAIEIDEDYYFEEVVRLPTPARPFGITYAEPYLWVTNRGTAENPGNTIMRIDLVALLGE